MTSEQMKTLARRYYDEVWCKGNPAFVDEMFAEDYANYDPSTPGVCLKGREAFKALMKSYRDSFPDLRFDVDDVLVEGDRAVITWRASGTHKGALMGIPPTGKSGGNVQGMTITRFRNGRIVEDRAVWDTLGLLRQLGVIPL